MLGRKSDSVINENSTILVDGRSVLKSAATNPNQRAKDVKTTLSGKAYVREVSNIDEASIFSIKSGSPLYNERWVVLNYIKEIAAGDDFILMKSRADWKKYIGSSAYRWLIICPLKDVEKLDLLMMNYPELKLEKVKSNHDKSVYKFVSFQEQEIPDFSLFPESVWIARSALVYFMQRDSL
jgi:hypothetical protein